MKTDIPLALRKARKAKGLTLEQLAVQVNSSKTYIWRLEKDASLNPGIKLIAKIADVLDLMVDELLYPAKERKIDSEINMFIEDFLSLEEALKKGIIAHVKEVKKYKKNTDQ